MEPPTLVSEKWQKGLVIVRVRVRMRVMVSLMMMMVRGRGGGTAMQWIGAAQEVVSASIVGLSSSSSVQQEQ